MKAYIQRKDHNTQIPLETVSEKTETMSMWDFRKELQEYQYSDYSANYYISQRACKDWHLNS